MKRLTFLILVLIFSFNSWSQSITIIESGGWLETAYVKWQPVSGASSYNVYYTGVGISDRKIDSQLIRNYGTYYRADILGLAAGVYTVKVTPVISGVEGAATITGNLTVLAHDRTGFAFDGGRVPGSYKADGTIKDNAIIIYITQNTKNNVSLNVTGATTNPCIGLQAILDGFKKGKDNRPLIVRLIGNITDFSNMQDGDIVIENNNNASGNITLEGVGCDAVANGWGIRMKGATNIEIRNIGAMNCNSTAGDNFGLQQDNDHIWLHNCDMFYGDAGSDADQIKGDGALDNKGSTYITFSYNHFWDNGKASLLGLSEGTTTGLYITYHHNWFDHSDSRHPRVRYYSAHVYNNYYDGNSKYGVGSTLGSSVFVEGNYFRNCKRPMMTSMQGTDIWDVTNQVNNANAIGTFSGEDGGTIKAFNNTFDYTSVSLRFVAYGDPSTIYNIAGKISSTIDFDAYVPTTRSELVPSTVKSFAGANTYNNFDTDAALYIKNLVIDAPEVAKEKALQYAGRVNGGDLKFTFNNAVDDPAYLVNSTIKTALTYYVTTLVSVQGEGGTTVGNQTLTSTTNYNQTVTSGTEISTIVFTWGGDATDATVTGLPASGVSFVKNVTAKTITITGMPTATVSYSITTVGTAGTPSTTDGKITVTTNTTDDMTHNFTLSGKTSNFYTITGNLSTSYGNVTYAGLTLTQCLKMESSTNISFTTTTAGTIKLVFNSTYTGSIQLDGTVYTPTAGIISIPISAGNHTILKGSGSNYLFYITIAYTTNVTNITDTNDVSLFPNPASTYFTIATNNVLNKIELYNLSGILVKNVEGSNKTVDINDLNKGSYIIKVFTNKLVDVQKLTIK